MEPTTHRTILGTLIVSIMLLIVGLFSTGAGHRIYERVTHWARAPEHVAAGVLGILTTVLTVPTMMLAAVTTAVQTILLTPATRLLAAATATFALAGLAFSSLGTAYDYLQHLAHHGTYDVTRQPPDEVHSDPHAVHDAGTHKQGAAAAA